MTEAKTITVVFYNTNLNPCIWALHFPVGKPAINETYTNFNGDVYVVRYYNDTHKVAFVMLKER